MSSENITGVIEHKKQVALLMEVVASELFRRAAVHDNSKFSSEEFDTFEQATPLLKTLTYGSDEYKAALESIKPALQHHYNVNDHHPEYHGVLGVNGMDLIQLIEMVCDWMAAVQRMQNGDIHRSLDINRERFNIDRQLFDILKNTVNQLIISSLKG